MIAIYQTLRSPYRMITMIILLGYLITLHVVMPTYINVLSANTICGVAAIMFTWQGETLQKFNFRWLFVVGVLLLLYIRIPSKFILYIAIGTAAFSLIETIAGKAGRLTMFCLILMSPLFEYITNVFGFPIRLQLTQIAGYILHCVDKGYMSEGNVLIKDSAEFSVDTACMGLHMLISSILTGIVLIGIYQRRLGKKLSLKYQIAAGLAILILNLFSNLVRIISLVEFKVMPENKMHAGIGLACFAIYVLLPSVFLVKYLVHRFGTNHKKITGNFALNPQIIIIQISLLIVIFGTAMAGKDRSMNKYLATGIVKAPGYRVEILADAIVKLSTDNGLIYLKPIVSFYSSDHQPTMCWEGSGYDFRNLELFNLDGEMIYISSLEKGNDKLFTAWWYDNGKLKTVSQVDWRWDSFINNKPWALVNVTANSKSELFNQIRQIRRINPCRMLLNPV